MDPSTLTMVGVSYRGCPDEVRDRLYLTEDDLPSALAELRRHAAREALIVSTCDRIEAFAHFADGTAPETAVATTLARHAGLPADTIAHTIERLDGRDAVRHLFRVTASLDSQVIGEPQVLGQVKTCHGLARTAGLVGGLLEPLLQAAYETAKRVRTETRIAEGPVSIAAAAEHAARDLHGDLSACRAVLIGTGEMGVLLSRHLIGGGVETLTVVDRSPRRAEAVARDLGAHFAGPVGGADLPDADIIVTAVGDGRHAITPADARALLRRRRRRPVLFVDLGVPNDVDPAVARLDEAFLFDLDDLERVAIEGKSGRHAAADAAERIVAEEVDRYLARQVEREAVPTIRRLRDSFEAERARLLLERPGADAEEISRLLISRLLHRPSGELRRMALDGDLDAQAEALLERLFAPRSRNEE